MTRTVTTAAGAPPSAADVAPPAAPPLRIRLAGAAAVVSAVALITEVLVEPAGAEIDDAHALAAAAAHPAAWQATGLLEVVAYTAAAFVAATATGLVRGRGAVLTAIGGWLTTAAMLVIGLNGLPLVQGVLARQPDRAAMLHLLSAIDGNAGLRALLVLAIGSLPGPLLLALGLWRGHRAGWWLPALSGLGVVLYVALGGGDSSRVLDLLVQLPLAALIVGFGAAGLVALRRSAREPAPVTA